MRVISVQSKIRNISKSWNKQYPPGGTLYLKHVEKGKVLAALDPEKTTAETIAGIIGNASWTSLEKCDECWGYHRAVVLLGGTDGCEEYRFCKQCLEQTIEMLSTESTREETS